MKIFHVDQCSAAVVCLGLLLTQGCVNPAKTKIVSGALPRPGAKVVVGTSTNQTGQQFGFNIETEFRTDLEKQLAQLELLAPRSPAESDFLLNVNITDYRPGSAFERWVVPGWGSTVLTVRGDLLELDSRKVAAQIEDQRSVAAGGLYTIGAEHYIFNNVARDLAKDLRIRISKGGDFVLEARSRADVVAVTQPGSNARTVWLTGVTDKRADTGPIGERFAAFGVSMGDIYFSRDVADYFRENLELELTAAGCRLSNTNANLVLACDVNKFWVTTKTTPLYWDVVADISITVSKPNQAPPQRQEFSASASKRTYVWPSASLCGEVLNQCMAEVMKQFRESKAWQ
jgi:uncharacterized lipoprotein YajG